jgi:hypothetical protein
VRQRRYPLDLPDLWALALPLTTSPDGEKNLDHSYIIPHPYVADRKDKFAASVSASGSSVENEPGSERQTGKRLHVCQIVAAFP